MSRNYKEMEESVSQFRDYGKRFVMRTWSALDIGQIPHTLSWPSSHKTNIVYFGLRLRLGTKLSYCDL